MQLDSEGASSCPICGADAERVVLHWNGVTLYQCARCTHIYTSNLSWFADPSHDGEIETFYGEDYLAGCGGDQPDYVAEFERYRRHSHERLQDLRRYASPPGHLLEVGCNVGFFVKAAQEEGWTPTGLDISPAAIAIARDRTHGIPFVTGTLEEAGFQANSFDVVCCYHTLEHLPTPMQTLEGIHRLLAPGGILHVEVPYTRRIIGRRGVTDYSALAVEQHLHHFSPQSLSYALNKSRFRVREMRLVGGGYGLGILQPKTVSAKDPDVPPGPVDRMRLAIFAARRMVQWTPRLRRLVRRFYWHTLRQGGGVEAFAQKI